MSVIHTNLIYDTVKNLALLANTVLPVYDYDKLCKLYDNEENELAKSALSQILDNVKIACCDKRPLCQDTGFVTIFLEIGQNVHLEGELVNIVINNAIADAYNEYFLRKSIVESPIKRINTENNTPALIHTQIVAGDNISIYLVPKGGGCENVSAFKMLMPADGLEGVKKFVLETVKSASSKPCPPIKVGIGIGSNFEGSAILSKKALLIEKSVPDFENFENDLCNEINKLNIGVMGLGGNSTCFDVKILQDACHIASLPVSVSVSCHSSRHAKAIISEDKVEILPAEYKFKNIEQIASDKIFKVNSNDIETIKSLKVGTDFLLSGKIYTARDAAHKKMVDLLNSGCDLPFEIKNSIIFYAGPCPANNNEVIGPVGPTTSARMDEFTPLLYDNGLLATIGKGNRSSEVDKSIRQNGGKYFTITGGVASLLKKCVKSSRVVAYPELGAEAIFELEVKNLPLIVKI